MYDLCAIGNACIDIAAKVDDEFLALRGFEKGICTYLTLAEANELQDALPSPAFIPGGCGANTAAVMSSLGGRCAFIGKLSGDDIGRMFLEDLQMRGIDFIGAPGKNPEKGSTRVFAMTTPDAERTFTAYYGIQENLCGEDVDNSAITQSRILYLDGYALNSSQGAEAFLKAAQISKNAENLVAFSPSDLSILRKYSGAVRDVAALTDIFLCNEYEAAIFTGQKDKASAINILAGMFPTGAVTMGAEGAIVFQEGTVIHVPPPFEVSQITDLNGAGDAFAGGLLFGLSRDMPIDHAARLGHFCAAEIISRVGARPEGDYSRFLGMSA